MHGCSNVLCEPGSITVMMIMMMNVVDKTIVSVAEHTYT